MLSFQQTSPAVRGLQGRYRFTKLDPLNSPESVKLTVTKIFKTLFKDISEVTQRIRARLRNNTMNTFCDLSHLTRMK